MLVWLIVSALTGISATEPTPHPWSGSTWPSDVIPGEDCLPYDGSKVPDCTQFVIPYYHEHSSNCSRFWECGQAFETCLFECASCCRNPDEPEDCYIGCQDQNGHWNQALFFDESFHFWPEGPTCVWPMDYEGSCTMEAEQTTQAGSTWPTDVVPGEYCLPYDGSKVPDCTQFVDPDHYIPYYHEHSSNCSRFWECGPAFETCLFECAGCCRNPEVPEDCYYGCQDQDGHLNRALFFDERFHFWPEGPTCMWPMDYEGSCTMGGDDL